MKSKKLKCSKLGVKPLKEQFSLHYVAAWDGSLCLGSIRVKLRINYNWKIVKKESKQIQYSWELSFTDINTPLILGNTVRPNIDSTVSFLKYFTFLWPMVSPLQVLFDKLKKFCHFLRHLFWGMTKQFRKYYTYIHFFSPLSQKMSFFPLTISVYACIFVF